MTNNQLSLIARFDDFCRQTCGQNIANEIDLKYILAKTEENRVKWLQAENELRTSKKQVLLLREQVQELESKLRRLRQEYNREVYKTQNSQKNSEHLRAILDLVRKTVNNDFHSSKESLQTSSSGSIDHVLSILNDPEQFLKSYTRNADQVVLHSQSFDNIDEEELQFDKTDDSIDQSLNEEISFRRTRSSSQNNETILHRTDAKKFRIGSPISSDMNTSTSDHIERDIKTDSEYNNEVPEFSIPASATPHKIPQSAVSLRRNLSRKVVETDLKRLDSRPHNLQPKKIYHSTQCNVCDKRIGFCSNIVVCSECNSMAHIQCQKNLKLPCIKHFSPKKSDRKLIGDFAPDDIRPFVPSVLIYCCNEIESRGLKEEGIYRKCGSEREIRELKTKILKSKNGCPNLQYDVHTLCGVVKSFLKNLDEPLVPSILWNDFIKTTECMINSKYSADYERIFLRLLNRLPDANRDVMAYIILHLKKVSEESIANKMEEANLARIFAPTIVGWSSTSITATAHMEENPKQIQCMQAMISLSKSFWQNVLQQPRPLSSYGTLAHSRNKSFNSPAQQLLNSLYSTPNALPRNVRFDPAHA